MKSCADLDIDRRAEWLRLSDAIEKNPDVLVIGGGVIGVCAAYALSTRQKRVVVIDAGSIGAGSSYGNAGLIVPSHSLPLAVPGVIGKGLRWMLDKESPFYIRPRADSALFSWLLKFRAAATEERFRQSLPVLGNLLRASRELYDDWTKLPGMECAFEDKGLLYLYRTAKGLDEGRHEADLVAEVGLSPRFMDQAEVQQLIPRVRSGIAGGIRYSEDAHLDPQAFVLGMARQAEGNGAAFFDHTEAIGFKTAGREITTVKTTKGDIYPDQVVLATGAWTPAVARELELKIPIQAAKGYSLTFRRPDWSPPMPLNLSEAKVAVTPMGSHLRLAGTLELAGMDLSINARRVDAIRRGAGTFLEGMDNLELLEIWRGLRPCTPDGLPILGTSSAWDNLIVAAGHAMIGMSLGPVTGEVVAQLASGEVPDFNLDPLAQERFA